MYLRQSCPARGWGGQQQPQIGRSFPDCHDTKRPLGVRRRARGGTNEPLQPPGEWVERNRVMSPGEQVTLSATAVDWGSMEDEPQMNTLDALERRMGHTSRGLSQLHHLLEYLLSKMVDGAAESRRHTQVLCRKLIKNHMETYTALATLRAVLTDLSKDPENCLHSLEQIVGKIDPVSLGCTKSAQQDLGKHNDIPSAAMRDTCTADWLCMSDAGTVIHQEQDDRGMLSDTSSVERGSPCNSSTGSVSLERDDADADAECEGDSTSYAYNPASPNAASRSQPAREALRLAVNSLLASGAPHSIVGQAQALLQSLDAASVATPPPPPSQPRSRFEPPPPSTFATLQLSSRLSSAGVRSDAHTTHNLFNETSSTIQTLIAAGSDAGLSSPTSADSRHGFSPIKATHSPLASPAQDVMSLGQLVETEAMRVTTPRTTMRNKRQSTRASPVGDGTTNTLASPVSGPLVAEAIRAQFFPHPPSHVVVTDAVSAVLCIAAMAGTLDNSSNPSAEACGGEATQDGGEDAETAVPGYCSSASSSELRRRGAEVGAASSKRRHRSHLRSSLVGSHFLHGSGPASAASAVGTARLGPLGPDAFAQFEAASPRHIYPQRRGKSPK